MLFSNGDIASSMKASKAASYCVSNSNLTFIISAILFPRQVYEGLAGIFVILDANLVVTGKHGNVCRKGFWPLILPLVNQFFAIDKNPDTIIGCHSELIDSCRENDFSGPADGESVGGHMADWIGTLDPPVCFQKARSVIEDH